VKYFPDALVAVARLSFQGNQQHNPGQPLHWSREKSCDHEDTLLRHLFDSGTVDVDGQRHSTKLAWRALALLQLELEKEAQESEAASPEDREEAFEKARWEEVFPGSTTLTGTAVSEDPILPF
jgi:hypothetical protein